MEIKKQIFGKLHCGRLVSLYEMGNHKGVVIRILDYGGTIMSISVPDRDGCFADIVLGCDTLEDYLSQNKYFGAITGRYANRIENGRFELNGNEYVLAQNDGLNHLHGGLVGFDKILWGSEIKSESCLEYLELTYRSPHGEEGYPGNLDVRVEYMLSHDNELIIRYFAETDKDTIINLSNHSYFNLLGQSKGDISRHFLKIEAEQFTAVDENGLTNGEILDVKNTPFDFRELTVIEAGLKSDDLQIRNGLGYDHNWVLLGRENDLQKAAELYEESTGRVMEVYTTKPGL